MHRCQSNKYQAASESGELEVFASPRLASTHVVYGRDRFINLNSRNEKKCRHNSHMHRIV